MPKRKMLLDANWETARSQLTTETSNLNSCSTRSWLTMASTLAEIVGLYSCEGHIEKPPDGMSPYIK